MPIVSLSVNESILKKFDRALEEKGYATRSKAFRDAIRDFIDESEWALDEGTNSAILVVVYDEKEMPMNRLYTIQHAHKEIQAALHVHLDDKNCLEIFVAKGTSMKVKELIRHIRHLSGIKQLKFITTASGV